MLTSFDLRPGVSMPAFQEALGVYAEHMREQDLLDGMSQVGARQRDTILDTDEAREQDYFFVMHFRDRAQADAAVAAIEAGGHAGEIHRAMHSRADNMVFLCWEDLPDYDATA